MIERWRRLSRSCWDSSSTRCSMMIWEIWSSEGRLTAWFCREQTMTMETPFWATSGRLTWPIGRLAGQGLEGRRGNGREVDRAGIGWLDIAQRSIVGLDIGAGTCGAAGLLQFVDDG